MNLFRKILKPKQAKTTSPDVFAHPMPIASQLDVGRVHSAILASIQGDNTDLYTIYRDIISSDSHLQSELSKRKLAVLGDVYNILPEDPDQPIAAELIQDSTSRVQDWTRGLSHAMDSVLYPVAVVEKVFRKSTKPGLRYELAKLVPVDHHLIEFHNGVPHLRELNEMGYPTGALVEIDPERYIVHVGHLLSTPHQFGGPFRSILFWCLFTAMDRDWWVRFLERFGSPFLLGKYDANDDQSRRILERAFRASAKIFGLVVTNETEVEIQQAAASNSGDAYEKFMAVGQREKSKFILGQTASSEGTPGKLGNDQLQSDVREDIRQFDAAALAETIQYQLYEQLMRINSIPGETPTPAWGIQDTEEAAVNGALIQSLSQAGITVTDEGLEILGKRIGFPLRRMTTGPIAPTGFSVDSKTDAIDGQAATLQAIRRASADWSQNRRERHAEASRIILSSESPEAAIAALSASLGIPSTDATELLATVLNAGVVNGILTAV
jgi:phage gp29-like protein